MLFKTRYPSMTYNQLTGKVVLKKYRYLFPGVDESGCRRYNVIVTQPPDSESRKEKNILGP